MRNKSPFPQKVCVDIGYSEHLSSGKWQSHVTVEPQRQVSYLNLDIKKGPLEEFIPKSSLKRCIRLGHLKQDVRSFQQRKEIAFGSVLLDHKI